MDDWILVYDAFEPAHEKLRESLCALGNGYIGTRAAAPEARANEWHYPGTHIAGVFNRLRSEVGGRLVETESNPNLPNWLALSFRVAGGRWFDLRHVEIEAYRHELDMRRGVVTRRVRIREQDRRTQLEHRWFLHMGEPHLAALEMSITPLNWSGRIEVRSAIDGRVDNSLVERDRDLARVHLDPVGSKSVGEDTIALQVETNQSHIRIAEAARTRFFRGGSPVSPERRLIEETSYIAHEAALEVSAGEPLIVEKVAAIYHSRDRAISESLLEATEAAGRARGFEALLEPHVLAWEHLWRQSGFELDAPERVRRILNLHIFHLLQTASPHTGDLDVGIPARGLTGEAYHGHIFWDEVFAFPFLNLRLPQLTRGLLLYRYRRLDRARIRAQEAGLAGALYPWRSGSSGREETPAMDFNPRSGRWIPDHTALQRHIDIAVAYNVIHHYEMTGDLEFLRFFGMEMLIEIARFWSSIATYDPDLQRYEIRGVIGPDEYHTSYPGADRPGLDNNAYTNLMTVWVILRTLELLDEIPDLHRRILLEQLQVSPDELERWDDISRRMRVVFHGDGIISQFEGYDELEELDWDAYRERYGNIQRLDRLLEAEHDTPNRYQASKQADVLMLFYLLSAEELEGLFDRLGYRWERETIPKNIDYYLARTSNGSTLSRVVHSWVLARSRRQQSWDIFTAALSSDISDIQGGTTAEGIHLGAMAGTVDAVQRCYTGMETREGALWLNPVLPDELDRLGFEIDYRGQQIRIEMTHDRLRLSAQQEHAAPVTVYVRGERFEIHPGTALEVTLTSRGERPLTARREPPART